MSKSVMLLGFVGMLIGACVIEAFRKGEFYEGRVITLSNGKTWTLTDDLGYGRWEVSESGTDPRTWKLAVTEEDIKDAIAGVYPPYQPTPEETRLAVLRSRDPVEAPRN